MSRAHSRLDPTVENYYNGRRRHGLFSRELEIRILGDPCNSTHQQTILK